MEVKETVKGHRARLRKSYREGGYEGLHDYEILELLLTYAIPRKDVKDIAKELLDKYGNITNVLNEELFILENIKGLGENSAILIRLVGDIIKNVYYELLREEQLDFDGKQDYMRTKESLLNYLTREIGYEKVENFIALFLNNSNKIVGKEILFCGTIDKSAIYPREIVEAVIKHGAKGVIFAHNHPSGNLRPSNADIEVTHHMIRALNMLDVKVLDHIIIDRSDYFSFLEEGLI